jgi:hypothetical protein
VPELVVDALEAREVEQCEAERVAGAAGALDLPEQVLVEGAVVAQVGERVDEGGLAQPVDLRRPRGAQARAVAGDERGAQQEQRDDHGCDDRLSDEDVVSLGIRAVGHHDVHAHPGQP